MADNNSPTSQAGTASGHRELNPAATDRLAEAIIRNTKAIEKGTWATGLLVLVTSVPVVIAAVPAVKALMGH
ncbi:hypothetical protein ACWC9T_20955 [Kitasatospora sp. NPDC001159]